MMTASTAEKRKVEAAGGRGPGAGAGGEPLRIVAGV